MPREHLEGSRRDVTLGRQMPIIPDHEIETHPASVVDESGKLFTWDNELYRALSSEATALGRRLFAEGLIPRLVDRGLLIETELTDYSLAKFESVVWHRRVPFVSYCFEWSPEMLRDAALLVLDLNIELANQGLGTQDAHPWNVLFDGSRPVYVDFGSLCEMTPTVPWMAIEEFNRYFLRPLKLYSMGHVRIPRWFLHDLRAGVLESDLSSVIDRSSGGSRMSSIARQVLSPLRQSALDTAKRITPVGLKTKIRNWARDVNKSRHLVSGTRVDTLRRLRNQVGQVPLRSRKTEWSDYDKHDLPLTPAESWTPKQTHVHQFLEKIKPTTVLDMASNRGWWSKLARQCGASVVAFDTDDVCIDLLYKDVRGTNQPILPLVLDATNPSPGYGLHAHQMLPAVDRLSCQLVMALAVTHHLVFKLGLNFELIAEAMDAFSERWLIVEFVPADDLYVSEWIQKTPSKADWYNLENFLEALRQYFQVRCVTESYPTPRQLVLCEK